MTMIKLIITLPKLQQYLNKLPLALTRSKTSAILGTPLGETIPINDDNAEMDVESDSDSDSDGVSIGQQSAQPSAFYTPMRTPSTALRALSRPTTPNNISTFTPRRRLTSDSEQPSTSKSVVTSVKTSAKTRKRIGKGRPSKQKFSQENILKQFPKDAHAEISHLLDRLKTVPNIRWDTEHRQYIFK